MIEKILIFGTGLIGELAEYYLRKDYNMKVEAYTVDSNYIKEEKISSIPIVEFENIEKRFSPDKYRMFIALSYNNLNILREEKYKEAKKRG
ncbi:MAG: hypothetical protein WC358_08405 [Ignavibacteria bacterium]|jgi:lactate dehydrogenase-like 2-hydroxyacid dehydrogenase